MTRWPSQRLPSLMALVVGFPFRGQTEFSESHQEIPGRNLSLSQSQGAERCGLQYSENMRLLSLTSSVRVNANISRMRDFCGLSVSAATYPS
jgi:hypothetical protein